MSERLSANDIQAKFDDSPFIAWLNMKVESVDYDEEKLVVHVPMRRDFERRSGSNQWHGGPLAAIVDTVGDFAVGMLIGRGLATINFRVDYLRPAIKTSVTAVARVRRNGRSVGVADVDLYADGGALLAIGRASFSTLPTAS